jgi:hypothetical protein
MQARRAPSGTLARDEATLAAVLGEIYDLLRACARRSTAAAEPKVAHAEPGGRTPAPKEVETIDNTEPPRPDGANDPGAATDERPSGGAPAQF